MMAATRSEWVKKYISYFYTQLRTVQPAVTGKDLEAMGLAPGPIYREILDAVRHAKLNGDVKSRNDEIEFIKNYVQ
jgi:tRNA nucleotidyltransferase (CCA-adding enzyme)